MGSAYWIGMKVDEIWCYAHGFDVVDVTDVLVRLGGDVVRWQNSYIHS